MPPSSPPRSSVLPAPLPDALTREGPRPGSGPGGSSKPPGASPRGIYQHLLATRAPEALDATEALRLSDAAGTAHLPTDAYVFLALAARLGQGPVFPPLPGAGEGDTQLRAWRHLVASGIPHHFVRVIGAGEDLPRARHLLEALRRLGHRTTLLPLEGLLASPLGLCHGLAQGLLDPASPPRTDEAIVVGYAPDALTALEPALHHLTVIYGNPEDPGEGFYARYLQRTEQAAPLRSPTHPPGRPTFSLVIPTRNNPHCLAHNLRTCLEQRFQDFEIVIGDNSDPGNEETARLVRSLDSDRIHYFRTDRFLDLADSFEFAHARARGEYVLGLGSDDGLLPHGLATLAQALHGAGEPVDALRFDFLYYGWPNAQPRRFQNFIRIPPSIRKQAGGPQLAWHDSRETLERFARYEIPFYDIPNGYGYSILSRRLLEQIRKKTGRCFPGHTQDVYTGVYGLCLTPSFATLPCPITAFAVSGSSVGSQNTYGGPEFSRIRHALDPPYVPEPIPAPLGKTDKEGRDPHYDPCTALEVYGPAILELCGYSSDEVVNAQAVLDAVNRKLLAREYRDRIDWKRYFTICSQYLYEDDPRLGQKLEEMLDRVQRRKDAPLEAWFREAFYENPHFRGHQAPLAQERFRYGLLPNGVLYLDGAEFGVTNVYEAVQLFRKVSHLEEP